MSLSPVLDAGPLLGVTSRRAIKRRLQVLGVPLVAFGPRLYVEDCFGVVLDPAYMTLICSR